MDIQVNRKQGFTLVEIMIVVAIIGLLAAAAIPSFVRARENSREKVCVNNLRQLHGAKDLAAIENGLGNGGDVSGLVAFYLKAGIPVCPVGNVGYDLRAVGETPVCQSGAAASHNNAYQN
jgi:prepilin-type N-terminal cleavage/methylation domain-containing protein